MTQLPSQLDHVMLGSTPADTSPYAVATGLSYDIRTDKYGSGPYTIRVNRQRVGEGTVAWIVHRDGSYGVVAGVMIYDDMPVYPGDDGLHYKTGLLWPLPSDYWIDGARLRLDGWAGAPFKAAPNRFQNGQAITDGNARILLRRAAAPVVDWLRYHNARVP